ncbi:MAG: T9SS type A sorting domain-containing protein [Ignavibacteria bacterium]|nr:T9SS type A sorting domain-containing protein [Ignavibacteria bacterium]MCC7158570.1 T9SS type A sorting domain-containing protein [Ignavibacteria bacterium]
MPLAKGFTHFRGEIASRLESGVYFYTIKTGDFIQTKRMILVK